MSAVEHTHIIARPAVVIAGIFVFLLYLLQVFSKTELCKFLGAIHNPSVDLCGLVISLYARSAVMSVTFIAKSWTDALH